MYLRLCSIGCTCVSVRAQDSPAIMVISAELFTQGVQPD